MSLLLAAAAAAQSAAGMLSSAKPVGTVLPRPVAPALPPQPVTTAASTPQHFDWLQTHAGWLTHTIAGLFFFSVVLLIVLLAVQTTKQEGLSGTLGGQVQSAYGRPGTEAQLKWWTGLAATCFVIFGTILALTGI